jgi:hypothetical protein
MNPTAPRVYVYRKSGRTVWDVEIWLPDGKRKTWRSGLEDREAALHAGLERAQALLALPDAGAPDSALADVEAPMPAVRPDVLASDSSPPQAVAMEAPKPTVQGCEERQIAGTPAEVVPCGQTARPSRSSQNLLDRFDRWFWGQLGLGYATPGRPKLPRTDRSI